MTDAELARYLKIAEAEVAKLPADQRAAYERLAITELGIKLWLSGFAKPPAGVILCGSHRRRAKGCRK